MGTRRSKHNKGRKPFYKNISRTTLSDLQPAEPDRWENEAEEFFHSRHLNDLREGFAPQSRRSDWRIPKPDPELSATVKAYLAKKREEQQRHDVLQVFPDVRRNPERVSSADYERHAERVEPSKRDVLMEMFVERKITHGQMHAGRRWQANKEAATLQPSRTVDWANSRSYPYQARGGPNEAQWDAMKWRRGFIAAEGLAAAVMLDFALEADRGRDDLVRIMNMPAAIIESTLDELLTKICQHFGGRIPWRTTH